MENMQVYVTIMHLSMFMYKLCLAAGWHLHMSIYFLQVYKFLFQIRIINDWHIYYGEIK
jgi:hypothetical protein